MPARNKRGWSIYFHFSDEPDGEWHILTTLGTRSRARSLLKYKKENAVFNTKYIMRKETFQ